MTAQLWRARSVAQLNHSAVASQPAARFSCRFYIIFDWEWVRNEPGARAILSCFCLAFGHCSQFIWYFHFSVSRRRLTRGLISNNQGRSWNLEFRLFLKFRHFSPIGRLSLIYQKNMAAEINRHAHVCQSRKGASCKFCNLLYVCNQISSENESKKGIIGGGAAMEKLIPKQTFDGANPEANERM